MEDFSNEVVGTSQLPDWSGVELNRVARAYLPYALTSGLIFGLLLALGGGVAGWLMFTGWVGLIIAATMLFVVTPLFFLHSFMEYRIFGWAAREQDLINRYGVVWRKQVVIPFSRIQHVSTGNGPLERAFGLMHLRVFSAGGASADVTVQGLLPETAERVRHYILGRIGALNQDEAKRQDTAPAPEDGEGPDSSKTDPGLEQSLKRDNESGDER